MSDEKTLCDNSWKEHYKEHVQQLSSIHQEIAKLAFYAGFQGGYHSRDDEVIDLEMNIYREYPQY